MKNVFVSHLRKICVCSPRPYKSSVPFWFPLSYCAHVVLLLFAKGKHPNGGILARGEWPAPALPCGSLLPAALGFGDGAELGSIPLKAARGRKDDSKCSSCIVPSPLSASLPCHYLSVSPARFAPRFLSCTELGCSAPAALPAPAASIQHEDIRPYRAHDSTNKWG